MRYAIVYGGSVTTLEIGKSKKMNSSIQPDNVSQKMCFFHNKLRR